MTIANNLIGLALRNAGITGVGQTASDEDTNDAFTLLNEMIGQWQVQRTVMVIPVTLVPFPSLFVDQPFWTPYENLLLTTLSVRVRSAWGLPPDPLREKLADEALQLFQANNQQQVPPVHPAGGVPGTCMAVIFLALRIAGRITDQQSVSDSSKDVADAFAMLCMIVAGWQRKRWLIPDLTETIVTATGALSYTIGLATPGSVPPSAGAFPTSPAGLAPGTVWDDGGSLAIIEGAAPIWPPLLPGTITSGSSGAFAVARPDRIDAAFARFLPAIAPNALDYRLSIIESREEYASLAFKSLSTIPAGVFYDAAYPVGNLYFWPVPAAGAFELHIFTKTTQQVFATPNDALNFPPEYAEALMWSLAVRLEMAGGDPKQSHVMAMKAALATIRLANVGIPEMMMPPGLSPRRGSGASALSNPAFLTGRW